MPVELLVVVVDPVLVVEESVVDPVLVVEESVVDPVLVVEESVVDPVLVLPPVALLVEPVPPPP